LQKAVAAILVDDLATADKEKVSLFVFGFGFLTKILFRLWLKPPSEKFESKERNEEKSLFPNTSSWTKKAKSSFRSKAA
jgi:hypothetical protein